MAKGWGGKEFGGGYEANHWRQVLTQENPPVVPTGGDQCPSIYITCIPHTDDPSNPYIPNGIAFSNNFSATHSTVVLDLQNMCGTNEECIRQFEASGPKFDEVGNYIGPVTKFNNIENNSTLSRQFHFSFELFPCQTAPNAGQFCTNWHDSSGNIYELTEAKLITSIEGSAKIIPLSKTNEFQGAVLNGGGCLLALSILAAGAFYVFNRIAEKVDPYVGKAQDGVAKASQSAKKGWEKTKEVTGKVAHGEWKFWGKDNKEEDKD